MESSVEALSTTTTSMPPERGGCTERRHAARYGLFQCTITTDTSGRPSAPSTGDGRLADDDSTTGAGDSISRLEEVGVDRVALLAVGRPAGATAKAIMASKISRFGDGGQSGG